MGSAISRQRLDWRTGATRRVERAVGVAVIHVLDVDAAGTGALLHHQEKRSTAFRVFLRMAGSCSVLDVELFKLVLVREEGVIEAGCIGRGEQR